LAAAFERLVQSDMVAQSGEPPNAIYNFKHALIRDAAYQTILKSRKRDLHRRVAETLERRYPDMARSEPELLAHHYTEADVTERALDFWHAAAVKASANLAHAEAAGHNRKATAIISALPEGRPAMSGNWLSSHSWGRPKWRWRDGTARQHTLLTNVPDWSPADLAGCRTFSGRCGVSGWVRTALVSICGLVLCSTKYTNCSKRLTSRNTSCRRIISGIADAR
jgi:hypothetical protein